MIDKQRIAHDGEDPNGVKAYQEDVNHLRALAAELTEKCNHPQTSESHAAYISRGMASAGFPVDSEIMGCKVVVDDKMLDSMVHFPQPDGTCYKVNA